MQYHKGKNKGKKGIYKVSMYLWGGIIIIII